MGADSEKWWSSEAGQRHATRRGWALYQSSPGKGSVLVSPASWTLTARKGLPCDREEAHSKLDFGPVCVEWEHFQACKINPSNTVGMDPKQMHMGEQERLKSRGWTGNMNMTLGSLRQLWKKFSLAWKNQSSKENYKHLPRAWQVISEKISPL